MSVATGQMSTSLPLRATSLVPGAPRVPQVNLLPPEIRASRSLRKIKRVLLLVLVLIVAAAVAAYLWSTLQVAAADREVAAEQADTTRLLNAQKQYAEVPQVLSDLAAAREARTVGMSTEVLWTLPLQQLVATKPPGVAFEEIVMSGSTPMLLAAAPINPLAHQGTAMLAFSGRSLLVPDTAAWIESLELMPNFTDAYVTAMSITEEDLDGTLSVFYRVTGSVQVSEEALAGRFTDSEEG